MEEPSDADFRAAGFTAAARQFPLSAKAKQWIADFNGLPAASMPAAWGFAPNAYMQAWLEARP